MTRFILPVAIAAMLLPLAGCPAMLGSPEDRLSQSKMTGNDLVADDVPVLELVRDTLEFNQRSRRLSTDVHGAWQIMHGALAYGQDFEIQTPSGVQRAIDYLAAGGGVVGFEPRLGDLHGDRRGVRLATQPTTKVGQGHRDQWLAILVQSGLGPDAIFRVQGVDTTLLDWVDQAEFDVPLNVEYEYSWTLIALTAFRSTSHRWVARDGTEYSTELLLEMELSQEIEGAVCGGIHRLIGLAMAVQRRNFEGAPMSEIWADAQTVLDAAIEDARQNQNPDGSYSTSYLHRSGWARDVGESIGTTGHVLEFLSIAMDKDALKQPWVVRTVRRLCSSLRECEDIDLECGILYHALHALQLYESRLSDRKNPARS